MPSYIGRPWYKTVLCDTLIKSGSYLKGDFTLKSGLRTDTYIDCRKMFLDSRWLSTIIPCYVEVLSESWIKSDVHTLLCGIPTSGLVLTGAILMRAAVHKDIRACYLRPETKDHGTKKDFEGDIREGDEVYILDDVVTSGDTILKAINQLRARGLNVKAAVTLLDRSEGKFSDAISHYFGVRHISMLELRELEEYVQDKQT